MTHTNVASREGSLDPQLLGRWATQRKTATWQLKWVPTFGYGTKHRDFETRGVPLLNDIDRPIGGSPCTQGGSTIECVTRNLDIRQPWNLRSPCPCRRVRSKPST
jgi:hypothetical protein